MRRPAEIISGNIPVYPEAGRDLYALAFDYDNQKNVLLLGEFNG